MLIRWKVIPFLRGPWFLGSRPIRTSLAGLYTASDCDPRTSGSAAESVRIPTHDGWTFENSLLMRPLLSSALGIERPGRDGISDPGDLRIAVHQVSEERALQIALVASE
jgi:hypothetical protein